MSKTDDEILNIVNKAIMEVSKRATSMNILALSELLAHVNGNKTLTLDEFIRYTSASPKVIKKHIKSGLIIPIVYPDYESTHEIFFDREDGDKLIEKFKRKGFIPKI